MENGIKNVVDRELKKGDGGVGRCGYFGRAGGDSLLLTDAEISRRDQTLILLTLFGRRPELRFFMDAA